MEVSIGGSEVFKLFNIISITDTVILTWVIMGVLIVLGYLGGRFFKNRAVNKPPKGVENVVEAVYEIVENFVIDSMEEHNRKYIPYIGTLFIFILIANLSGLVGVRPPTSDLHTTAALAFISFFLIQKTALAGGVINYIKGFFQPLWIIAPLNIIGDIAGPFALAFRLFGNLFSGYLIMGILYTALQKIWFLFFIAQPMHIFFDLFSGAIQTLIFVSLTMAYISSKE